jgi:hypothetical protein
MALCIKPSDLKYRYPRIVERRSELKFQGPDDPALFNRDDLYDIIPLLEAVLEELGRDDGRTLHCIEDLMNLELPRSITGRGEVFRYLCGTMREILTEQ